MPYMEPVYNILEKHHGKERRQSERGRGDCRVQDTFCFVY